MEAGKSLGAYLKDAQKQIEEGISHASLSYCLDEWFVRGSGAATVIFHDDIYDYSTLDGMVKGMERIYSDKYPTACENSLDLEIIEGPEDFEAFFDYNGALYRRESIEKFAEIFIHHCEKLMGKIL